MLARVRRQPGSGRGARLARPALLIMTLLVLLLLVPATANADVMAKYRTKYKNKLSNYRAMMDAFSDNPYLGWKQDVEVTSIDLDDALKDPDHPENVALIKQSALDQRTLLQGQVVIMRDKVYEDIARFKAKAVNWFAKKADRNRFKARLATLRAGFTTLFSAYEDLMGAFYCLGVNADLAGCAQKVMAAEVTRTEAEDTFAKGWKQLRALQ
jgi:hypothetical protein